MLSKISNKILLLFAFVCLVSGLTINVFNSFSNEELCKNAEKGLRKKEERSLFFIDKIKSSLGKVPSKELFKKNANEFFHLFNKEQIALLVYESDSLKYWSTNRVSIPSTPFFTKESNGILQTRSGWFEYFSADVSPKYKIVALILLKPEYDIQNTYLKNEFSEWLQLPQYTKILKPSISSSSSALVKSIRNNPLFEIDPGETYVKSKDLSNYSSVLFFFFLLSLIFSFTRLTTKTSFKNTAFILFWVLVLALRTLMIYFKWPSFIYSSSFFDLSVFGNAQSFYNGYFGDIVLNAVLLLLFSAAYFFGFSTTAHKSIKTIWLNVFFCFVFLIFLSFQLNILIKSLVTNSTISFDFLNFFNLNFLSFSALAVVFLYGFSIVLFVEEFLKGLESVKNKIKLVIVFSSFVVYVITYVLFLRADYTFCQSFWIIAVLFVSYLSNQVYKTLSALNIGLRMLLFSIISTWLFNTFNVQNEKQNLDALYNSLADKQDPVLESEFLKFNQKFKKDSLIINYVYKTMFKSDLEQQIRQKYFSGYFEKYNIKLALFDSLCMPHFNNSEVLLLNNDYFEEQIKSASVPTIIENLFFIENYKSNACYIGKITLGETQKTHPDYILYIQMEPKQLADAGSFPEVLLDKTQQKQHQYGQYSYAVYKQNKLNTSYGDFNYPLDFINEQAITSLNTDFLHHYFSPDRDTHIIITAKEKGFNYYFTLNSYHFLFYTFLFIAGLVLYYVFGSRMKLFLSLNRRIQFFVISILFFALFAVGGFSVKLISEKFEQDRVKQLTEKNKRIVNELNNLLFVSDIFNNQNKYYAESVLKKYASLFNSDIVIYDNKGKLFSSSRLQLFDWGLISEYINPNAFANFTFNQSAYFITRDNIGSLNYLSLYTGVYSASGKLLGYINLPYFARQNDLEKELSDYFSTLLNIYVVLFLVSLLTGLIVSSYITKPLRIVQQQIAKTSFGKKNEPIQWQSEDEIGKLVNEYNQMLLKLEASALLLAQSEREGAWREMAKQVAHEIKNPLTPMKLNLQYLQKIINEESVDFKDKFKQAASSIIEQIDTLAHIAGEFSNFANMPKANLQEINLSAVINASTQLFENHENIQVVFNYTQSDVFVLADKEQCLRIFNNLIKNAIQAIPEGNNGKIEIQIEDKDEVVLVSVKDNGTGIPDNMKEKIFTPNFTTKTTGTGLGLAMVKNIMNSFSGSISFESREGNGSVFYLTFKKI